MKIDLGKIFDDKTESGSVMDKKQFVETVEQIITNNSKDVHNYASCMLSILNALKLYDNNSLELDSETLRQMMFRKMKGYNIDLNKDLGFTHLNPVIKDYGKITFEDFLKYYKLKLELKEDFIRDGQLLMNYLSVVWLEEFIRITNTEFDCYYNDKLIDNTLKHLEKIWKTK